MKSGCRSAVPSEWPASAFCTVSGSHGNLCLGMRGCWSRFSGAGAVSLAHSHWVSGPFEGVKGAEASELALPIYPLRLQRFSRTSCFRTVIHKYALVWGFRHRKHIPLNSILPQMTHGPLCGVMSRFHCTPINNLRTALEMMAPFCSLQRAWGRTGHSPRGYR